MSPYLAHLLPPPPVRLRSPSLTLSCQVLHLLHSRLLPRHSLRHPPALADLPEAPPPQHSDDRRLHPLRALAGRADTGVGAPVGSQRQRLEQLQPGRVWPEPDGPDARDAGVDGAEEHLPELAGRVRVWVGRGDPLVVDYGYGLSGFCG